MTRSETDNSWKEIIADRYPFDTVVFDIGGVILHGEGTKDSEVIIKRMIEAYATEGEGVKDTITRIMEEGLIELQVGTITADDIKPRLIKILGKPDKELKMNELLSQSYLRIDPVMVNVVDVLREKGIRVILATNTIPRHWSDTTEELKQAGLSHQRIKNTKIIEEARKELKKAEAEGKIPLFTSFNLNAAKGGKTSRKDKRGFFEAITTIANINPQNTLVVDDRGDYCQEASEIGMQTCRFETSSQFITDLVEGNLGTAQT